MVLNKKSSIAKFAIAAALTIAGTASSFGQLAITGVFDGPLTGGTPKGVELYASANIADLSVYGLGFANNGGGTDNEEFTLSGAATAGDFLFVASDTAGFNNFFGFLPTFTSGSVDISGDDAIELFQNGSVIDVYGDINTDGTGEVWDYLDGWAYRVNETGPDGSTFVPSNWTYSGINALDGQSSNSTSPNPIPVATFVPTTVPEPSSLALLGIGLVGFAARRRRS